MLPVSKNLSTPLCRNDLITGKSVSRVYTLCNRTRVPAEFYALDNAVLVPHVGSATHETRFAMGMLQVDNLRAMYAGKPLLTPVV